MRSTEASAFLGRALTAALSSSKEAGSKMVMHPVAVMSELRPLEPPVPPEPSEADVSMLVMRNTSEPPEVTVRSPSISTGLSIITAEESVVFEVGVLPMVRPWHRQAPLRHVQSENGGLPLHGIGTGGCDDGMVVGGEGGAGCCVKSKPMRPYVRSA